MALQQGQASRVRCVQGEGRCTSCPEIGEACRRFLAARHVTPPGSLKTPSPLMGDVWGRGEAALPTLYPTLPPRRGQGDLEEG